MRQILKIPCRIALKQTPQSRTDVLISVQASSKLPTNMLQQADQHWNWTAQCSCCGGRDQAKDRGHTHQEEAADSNHWAGDVLGCCQQEQHRTAEDHQKAVPQPYCKYGHSHIIQQFCHTLPEVYFITMFQKLAQSPPPHFSGISCHYSNVYIPFYSLFDKQQQLGLNPEPFQ